MGTSIYSKIAPKKIAPRDWERVYYDALKIAEYGQLAGLAEKDIDGYKVQNLVPVGTTYKDHWNVDGDLLTGNCTETFDMYKDISKYTCKGKALAHNSALTYLYDGLAEDGSSVDDEFSCVFNGKTQGERPHKYLLAIACLIASEFPQAAVVEGDITQGACHKACEIAKTVLGRDVDMPLQYDYERLYTVLCENGHTGDELTRRFLGIYKGARDSDYCTFVKEHFSIADISEYYMWNISNESAYTLARKWLESGLDLDSLCRLWKKAENDNFNLDSLVETLVAGKVHIEDKDTYDFTEKRQDDEEPDDVQMLFARVMATLSGMRRYVIDAFVPQDEIEKILKDNYGTEAVEKFECELSKQKDGNKHLTAAEQLYDSITEMANEMVDPKYDINEWKDLYFWDPQKDTIDPELFDKIIFLIRQIKDFGEQALYNEFAKNADRKYSLCMKLNKFYPIKQTTIDMLTERIDDDEFMVKYIGLLNVKREGTELGHFLRAMMLNTDAYENAWKCMIEKGDQE